jgi:hypothetical protein
LKELGVVAQEGLLAGQKVVLRVEEIIIVCIFDSGSSDVTAVKFLD